MTPSTGRARLRAAALGLLLVGGLGISVAAVPSAYADTVGSLQLHQTDDCTGPVVPAGSIVAVPFSIAFTGFTPDQVGIFSVTSADGTTSSTRFSVGSTGTTCSATRSASDGGFLASFTWTDSLEVAHTVSVAGVVGVVPPVDPSPTDSPWASPSATASPTASPRTPPSHSPTPTPTPTPDPTATTTPSRTRTPSATSLPSTGGGATATASGARLPTTGADPHLVLVALVTLVAGVLLVVVTGRLAPGRRQR